jgi:hypothetical protein
MSTSSSVNSVEKFPTSILLEISGLKGALSYKL